MYSLLTQLQSVNNRMKQIFKFKITLAAVDVYFFHLNYSDIITALDAIIGWFPLFMHDK